MLALSPRSSQNAAPLGTDRQNFWNFIMQHTTDPLQALGLRDINPGTWSGSEGWSKRTDGPLIDSINPATGRRLAQVRGATAEDYEQVMGDRKSVV